MGGGLDDGTDGKGDVDGRAVRARRWPRGAGLAARLSRRAYLSEEDRASALDALMVRPTAATLRRYAVLLCLSVVVAVVGLLQDSVAVVIGAMMVAPLMAPIMGIAASSVMGWGRRLITGLSVVIGSVAVAVSIAWLFARFLPEANTALPSEVLARTSPDVRDLLIALAAGGAGSYATVRREVSGALPGVAVAVALVPPLACVGILIGRGQPDLAGGAALLFVTNLFGIVLAASVVFFATGFVPADHFRASRHSILAGLAASTVATMMVAAVLTTRFVGAVDHARELKLATQTTVAWLGHADDLNRMSLSGSTVQVNITGKTAPPPVRTLTANLSAALGHPTTVDLRWIPLRDDATAPARPPLDGIEPVAHDWLAAQGLTLDGLTYNTAGLVVIASGVRPPHDSAELTALIEKSFPTAPPISVAWTHREPKVVTAAESDVVTVRTTTDAWTAGHPGVSVLAVDQTDSSTTVTLTGPMKPATDDLQALLRAAVPKMTITVQWVPGAILSRTSPPEPSESAEATSQPPTSSPAPPR